MSLKRARIDVTASEKLELLEQFKKLPKMSEKKAAEALKMKRFDKRFERGIKVVKDRQIVLVCNNLAGSKSRLLVIGKSKQPRCFKNVKTFPTEYRSSRNALLSRKDDVANLDKLVAELGSSALQRK